jgi:hypothetical protein
VIGALEEKDSLEDDNVGEAYMVLASFHLL